MPKPGQSLACRIYNEQKQPPTLEAQNLVLFNKEGRPHNLTWDAARKRWIGKIMFDRNGSDTYKTLGMYVFERVPPVTLDGTFELGGMQYFAQGRTAKGSAPMAVTGRRRVNNSATFRTSWYQASQTERHLKPGDIVHFSYAGVPDTSSSGNPALLEVLDVRPGEFLVAHGSNNSAYADSVPVNTTVRAINTIVTRAGLDWNSLTTNLTVVAGDRVTAIGTARNDGTYNLLSRPVEKRRNRAVLVAEDLLLPTGVASLGLAITLKSDLPTVYFGSATFTGNSTSAVSSIALTHPVSALLQVGDAPVYAASQVLTPAVSSISADRKTIELGGPIDNGMPVGQLQGVRMQLPTGTFELAAPVLFNAAGDADAIGTMRLFVTRHARLLETYGILSEVVGDELVLTGKHAEEYFSVNAFTEGPAGRQGALVDNALEYFALFPVAQQLDEELLAAAPTAYLRTVEFVPAVLGTDAIDSEGLTVVLNGRTFFVDQDDDDDSTIQDWVDTHAAAVAKLGIYVARTAGNGGLALRFYGQFPNVPVRMGLVLGDTTGYRVWHSTATIKSVNGTRLVIRVNGRDYAVGLSGTNTVTEVASWCAAHAPALLVLGILVEPAGSTIAFYTLDPEKRVTVAVFNKIPMLPNDASVVYDAQRHDASPGVVLSCNKVLAPNADFVELGMATGQVVALQGAEQGAMNIQYAVVGVEQGELTLSYQGPFWADASQAIVLSSAEFLREPRHGLSAGAGLPRMRFDWRETQTPAMFFYDFSGRQLKGYGRYQEWEASSSSDTFENWLRSNTGYMEWRNTPQEAYYVGPRPLLGGSVENPNVRLNTAPNADPKLTASPLHQQTVFGSLETPLYYEDDDRDITVAPEPLQVFVGYRSLDEGVDTARLYVTLEEDRAHALRPTLQGSGPSDDEFVFAADGTVTVEHATSLNFVSLGFAPGQSVAFTGTDVTDSKKRATLANNGRTYELLEVKPQMLRVAVSAENPMAAERSVKFVPPAGAPYHNLQGDPILIPRALEVTVTQAPLVLVELDVLAETEVEDPRFKLALDNIGRNIRPKDLYIFKEYDIHEAGVDWTILNRKRKELLQVQSSIYNYISSYKAVANAIDFFGYNDLAFVEYFVNLDPESDKFGKLFSSELIDLFNRLVPGFKRRNGAADRLPNQRYKKSNLFSLSYRITDERGNFAQGYNFDEVTTKLFGLQQWLEDNVVPIGTRIVDITGNATAVGVHRAKHSTVHTTQYKVTDGFSPAVGKVSGYMLPVQHTAGATGAASVGNADSYSIAVDFSTQSGDMPETVHVRVITFNAAKWDAGVLYRAGEQVLHNSAVWRSTADHATLDAKPGLSLLWEKMPLWDLQAVQRIERTVYERLPVNFVVNAGVDPHFLVRVTSANAYGACWSETKSYSVDYGVWD